MKRAEKEKRGFTLAELLVVVAIIGVLVAISIPIFTTQLEKARRSVDLYNARAVESVLVNAINDGSVQLPAGVEGDTSGIWVTIRREGKGWPNAYGNSSGTVFYGASPKTVINGHVKTGDWNANSTELQNLVKANGIDVDNLKVNSQKSDSSKPDGWDWIVIQVGYRWQNGRDEKPVLFTQIYSGFEGGPSGAHDYNHDKNCIGKLIGD